MAKKKSEESPLMQQHSAIKQKYPDAILLFRVGDFYETFGADAVITSQILGITLTKRNNGIASSLELAGFPHHALDTYLHKLVKAGYRVAICDQLEDPKLAKGIVKRGVTEIVTPGIAVNDKLLDHHTNNFLAGVHFAEEGIFGLAFLDISTGHFFIAEGNREYADKLLQNFNPAEVVFQRQKQKLFNEYFDAKMYCYALDEWIFRESYAEETLRKQFQTHSLKGFGVEGMNRALPAACAILHYLKDTEHPHLQHILSLQRIDRDDFLWMDRFTLRNLELLAKNSEAGNTLLDVLDNTVSPMGARLLKRWIMFPLNNIQKINERLDLVEYFILQADMRNKITQHLKLCGDVERLVSKIPLKKINPRELVQLGKGLKQIEEIKEICTATKNSYLKKLTDALNPCSIIAEKIHSQIVETPPVQATKGGIIQVGINKELDELRQISSSGKNFLSQLLQQEIDRTGISSLKIGSNNVFGYYLEVTNLHKAKVPSDWIRKQTLANAERYITPALKDYEEKILGAEEKILTLELTLYENLLNELHQYLSPIQTNGNIAAILDCLLCFANNSLHLRLRKPTLTHENDLVIKDGRHPVIEKNLPTGEAFIPNDLELSKNKQQIIILTGPNMSGKSALLRQTALITIMAHMGSFVPASEATIPLTDKIFTRVGATDNLTGGESTFMVEMNETASIINNLTPRSLVLLDEIGRGTSTYDGISIAWSIAEYLHQSSHQPKTLFATHYHELNELEEKFERIKNYHVTHAEVDNKIVFLRKLAKGGSTHSFGIHVAKMAGMPFSLVDRANEILQQLELKHGAAEKENLFKNISTSKMQLSIFDAHSEAFETIRKMLHDIDINRLTPVEALLKLQEIKNLLK